MYPDTNVMLAVCHLLASYEPAPVEAVVSGTGYNRVHVLDALWVLVTVGLVRREAGEAVVFKLIRFADVLDLAARLNRAREALAAKKSGGKGTTTSRARAPTRVVLSTVLSSEANGLQDDSCTVPGSEDGVVVGESESLVQTTTAAETPRSAALLVEEKRVLPELQQVGCTDIQAAGILIAARKHGRPLEWVEGWIAEAKQRADRPGGFVRRMVEQNADLPPPKPAARGEYREGDHVSPERKKQLDSFYDAEHERTRAANTRPTNRISDEEHDLQKEESGWTEMKEQLRRRIEAEAPAEKWGGRVYKRPTEEERAKIAEAKAELEARRKRQEPQETTSGAEAVSWEEEARAATPAEGEPDALAF